MPTGFRLLFSSIFIAVVLGGCGGGGGDTGGGPVPAPVPDNRFGDGTGFPMISAFTPAAGTVGTTVQIDGILFKPTVAENTVRFNGVTATVLSATDRSLVAVVPAGATTGTIEVSTTGGRSSSSDSFSVLAGSTPGVAWTTRMTGVSDERGSALSSGIAGLAWDGKNYVTVGTSLQYSSDLLRWTSVRAMGSYEDIARDGQLFVTLGSFGDIDSSSDGLTWTPRFASSGDSLYSVAKSPNRWVAVGARGRIVISSDGLAWTAATSPATTTLKSVAWSGTMFVAGGEGGTIMTSPDGLAWRAGSIGSLAPVTAVGGSASRLVAATHPSSSSATLIASADGGGTWTVTSGVDFGVQDIIYAGGQWVAVGYAAATSVDGVNWTRSDVPGILKSVIYTGSQYVAAGMTEAGAGAVFTSPDARTWTMRTSDQAYLEMARSPAGRMVIASNANLFATSLDGVAWEYGSLPGLSDALQEVTWFAAPNAFIGLARSSANTAIYQSPDGLAWTALGYAPFAGALGASPSLLVNVGAAKGISTSPDALNWTSRTNPTGQALRYVTWTGTQFLAVGDAGSVATSINGTDWVARPTGITANLAGALSTPSLLVAVGSNGTIITSGDNGASWVQRVSGTTYGVRRVAWTGSEYVAVGDSGLALRSVDAINWSIQPTPYTKVLFGADGFHFNDVLWTGSRLVVIGTRGLITTSP